MTANQAAFAVFVDANALFSAALRDILIALHLADAVQLHWSDEVLVELERALVRTSRATSSGAGRLTAALREALPEAVVPAASLPSDVQLPDAGDAHVLGAALAAGCTVLLTANLADFPAEQLARCGNIRALRPDDFLLALLAVQEWSVVEAVATARRKLQKPPLAPADYLEALAKTLPEFAAALRLRIDRLA